ncbi:MAG: hydrolase, partial [Microbacterium sp.]|nr:hydrolase [Microbacterium sp.]
MRENVARVRRPATEETPAFDLTYVRSGPRGATPVLVIPGGPGLASVVPYRGLRRWAARGGLDLIMVEHRGVGRSRTGLDGRPLPPAAMRVTAVLDDLAAVLDAEAIDRAVIVGSS